MSTRLPTVAREMNTNGVASSSVMRAPPRVTTCPCHPKIVDGLEMGCVDAVEIGKRATERGSCDTSSGVALAEAPQTPRVDVRQQLHRAHRVAASHSRPPDFIKCPGFPCPHARTS